MKIRNVIDLLCIKRAKMNKSSVGVIRGVGRGDKTGIMLHRPLLKNRVHVS